MVGHRNLSVHSIMSYSFTLLDIIIIRNKERDQFGASVIELDSVDFQNQSGTKATVYAATVLLFV